MRLLCSAIMMILFMWLVVNFQMNSDTGGRFVTLLILLLVVSGILSSANMTNKLEPFVNPTRAMEGSLTPHSSSGDLVRTEIGGGDCQNKYLFSHGAGYHPLKDVPVCLSEKDMFMFSDSECKPECCEFGKGTGFSCSTGCVCKDAKNMQKMKGRGGNHTVVRGCLDI